MQTETYKIAQGDSLSKIAQSKGTTVDALLKANPNIKDANKIMAGADLFIPKSSPTPNPSPMTETSGVPSNIGSPVTTPKPVNMPALPEPTAPAVNDAYFASSTTQVGNSRKALESAYKSELERISKEKTDVQAQLDDMTAQQESLIETDIQPLMQPFREKLENSERERLYITKNFEANQKLTDELEALLTEGNEIIKATKGQPLAMSVLNKRVGKSLDDIKARTGVIEAVMSARSGQIAEGYRMIDRSVAAISADRKDQLSFYETVYNFLENEKDDAGKRLIELDKDEKKFVEGKIDILKNDLKQAEENAQNIKNLMQDPDSALFMARAGVTLNDTPQQVNAKMAEQAAREEIADFKNEKLAEGYKFSPVALDGYEKFEVGGQTLYAKLPPGKAKSSKDGFFIDDAGNEVSSFDAATQFVNDNADASDEELKLALRKVNAEKKMGLSDSDINSIVDNRTKASLSVDDVQDKIVATLESQKDTYSKDEARDLAESQLKSALGYKDDQELPESYKNAIDDALVEVYGRSFWQRILPGGR